MTIDSKPSTSGIGSLPHHNIDAALHYSFQHTIPYLPQIPLRNPWEYMIAQALEGLPGLQAQVGGEVTLDLNVWSGRYQSFRERLNSAFRNMNEDRFALEGFEPSAATSSSWQPFLWELEERQTPFAKIQLAGPLTCQWALRTTDGLPADRQPELLTQVYSLILARALAMARRVRETGAQPLIYLDEPGIYAFTPTDVKHRLAFQELKLMVQSLRKENVRVGIHCCSNTDWKPLLDLGLDILSIDTDLSLSSLLGEREALTRFLHSGGTLSLGLIPTDSAQDTASTSTEARVQKIGESMLSLFDSPQTGRTLLRKTILTPSCGLGLNTPGDAEAILVQLNIAQRTFDRLLNEPA
jgi:hypothetical protein